MEKLNRESSLGAVKVKLMGDIAGVFGKRDFELALPDGATVGQLLRNLCEKYGQSFSKEIFNAAGGLMPTLAIFVNGEDIKSLNGLDTAVSGSKVELVVLPIYEGG